MTKRRPWFKFHTQDWRADPALRMCSPAARGLWADMLSLMHEAEPYGFLLIGGIAPTNKKLATLLSIDADLIGPLIGDLEENGVFSRDDEGVIYSRRMVRDAVVADDAREHIAKRWGKSTKSRGVTSAPNRSPNRDPIEKNGADPITKSQISESEDVAVAAARGHALLEALKARADGAINLTSGHVHHQSEISNLLRGGCTVEDIEAATDAITASFKARRKLFHSWAVIKETALEIRDRRLAGVPQPELSHVGTSASSAHGAGPRSTVRSQPRSAATIIMERALEDELDETRRTPMPRLAGNQ